VTLHEHCWQHVSVVEFDTKHVSETDHVRHGNVCCDCLLLAMPPKLLLEACYMPCLSLFGMMAQQPQHYAVKFTKVIPLLE